MGDAPSWIAVGLGARRTRSQLP